MKNMRDRERERVRQRRPELLPCELAYGCHVAWYDGRANA